MTLAKRQPRGVVRRGPKAHDHRASDLPLNASVAVVEIENPLGLKEDAALESGLRRDGTLAPGKEWRSPDAPRIAVVYSIKNDPLGALQARGKIDNAQYLAGRRWQDLLRRTMVGSVQAIDTTKEPVDGGRWPELTSDHQMNAMKELRRVAAPLGVIWSALVHDVLGENKSIEQAARERGAVSRRQIDHWGFDFRKALEVLAGEFGLATKCRK